jgi:hypothetical protein
MKKILLASTLLCLGAGAQAATVFSDNFNANATGYNATPSGWTIRNGTVDIIGNGYDDYLPGSGAYIDLDGSTKNAGILSHAFAATAGTHYTLNFDLAGNHRNNSFELVTVAFGTTLGTYSLPKDAGWTHYSLDFTPLFSGTRYLRFAAWGYDNQGMLLDNVSVTTPVPEPETYAMMLAGLGIIGLMARRRRIS